MFKCDASLSLRTQFAKFGDCLVLDTDGLVLAPELNTPSDTLFTKPGKPRFSTDLGPLRVKVAFGHPRWVNKPCSAVLCSSSISQAILCPPRLAIFPHGQPKLVSRFGTPRTRGPNKHPFFEHQNNAAGHGLTLESLLSRCRANNLTPRPVLVSESSRLADVAQPRKSRTDLSNMLPNTVHGRWRPSQYNKLCVRLLARPARSAHLSAFASGPDITAKWSALTRVSAAPAHEPPGK